MAAHPVTHPSADALRAFALGKLNDSTVAALMNHLDDCPDCCKAVEAVSGDDFLARLRQARNPSSTSRPAQTLITIAGTAQPTACQTPISNLPPELAANQQYEILRELGRGGMGVVYLAKNKLMDRLEVLKVVNKTLLDHPGAVERFLREIRSAAKLSHANVVGAYSAVQQDELLAFAMEYVEGQDLASVVKSQGTLPVVHACYYVQQAALGLQHAYEKGMVHRDIKPQNLILTHKGKKQIVKVLDFGLAKARHEKTDDTGLTGEGKMLGTPDYIAPEQTLDAARADIRADIYSLGCTLYYLLAGHPPFSGSSLGAILLAHQMHEAKPLNLVRPEVPEELAAVVRKMMTKTPAKRYQTPQEVVQALAPFVKQGAAAKPAPELSVGTVGAKPFVKPAAPVAPPGPAAEAAKKQPQPAVLKSRTEGDGASIGPRKSAVVRKSQAATLRERSSRQRWLIGGGLGVGVLLLALVGMWASGVFTVKTPEGSIVLENVPHDDPEPKPREKQLEDLMVAGSVWKGTFKDIKGSTGVKESGRLVIYVQQGDGSTFNAILAYHDLENGTFWQFLRPVRGMVKGNNLDFRSAGSDLFRFKGAWENGRLELSYHKYNGAEATAKLNLEEARPKSASCVVSVFHRNDTEGWHTLNNDYTKGATGPIEVDFSGNHRIQHDHYYWLVAHPIPNHKEWGWHAPHKFHGDHSGKFGRCLIYQIWCDQTGHTPSTDWYVVLRGAGMTLFLDGTTLKPPEPKKNKGYCVRLDASAGWKIFPTRKRASDEDIKKVLAYVTDLRIKGEYGRKSVGCLHTVEFGADDPVKKN